MSQSRNCSSTIFPESRLTQDRERRSTKHKSENNEHKKKHKHNEGKRKKKNHSPEGSFSSNFLNVNLRHHDALEFEWTFTMPKYQPLDLYFLFDLSYSMKQDLKNLIDYSNILFQMFLGLYPKDAVDNFHVGFGSFVDKRLMPASSENEAMLDNPCKLDGPTAISKQYCKSNFVFENNLALGKISSEDFASFLEANVFVR